MLPKLRTTAKLAGLIVLLGGFVGLAQAQTGSPTTIEFPMVGVGHGQSLRVSLTDFKPCIPQIAVADSHGTPVNDITDVHEPSTNSTTFSTTFDPDKVVPTFPRRAELHVVITLNPPEGSPGPCQAHAHATAEIFDTLTGFTSVLVPPVSPTAKSPTFAPVGLGYLQTVRLNVVARPPTPCSGTLSFNGADGKQIKGLSFNDAEGEHIGSEKNVCLRPRCGNYLDPAKTTKTGGLKPCADYLDLTGLTTVGDLKQHAEVVPIFKPTPRTAPDACDASVEVYDWSTGWTRALALPRSSQ